jgi:hypothetical protein
MTEKANLQRQKRAHEEALRLGPGEEGFYRVLLDFTSPYSSKLRTYLNYKVC